MGPGITGKNLHGSVLISRQRSGIFFGFTVFVVGNDNHLAEDIFKNCLSVLIVSSPFNDFC
jgi:hypothetical protein